MQNLDNPTLTTDDIALMKKVVSVCDILETHWDQIARFCEQAPSTLAHGGFQPKNIHILYDQNEIILFPVDWEMAGWGVPAADLATAHRFPTPLVDLTVYHSMVKNHWPNLNFSTLEKLAGVGRVFCQVAAIDWASMSLEYPWPEKAITSLEIYHEGLSESIQANPGHGESLAVCLMQERERTMNVGDRRTGAPGSPLD